MASFLRTSKKQRKPNALQGEKIRSTPRIVGPADVLAIAVLGGCPCQPQVGSDGIAVEVARLRARALVEVRHG